MDQLLMFSSSCSRSVADLAKVGLAKSATEIGVRFRRIKILQPDVGPVQPEGIAIDDAGFVGCVALVVTADRQIFVWHQRSVGTISACARSRQAHSLRAAVNRL